MKLLKLTWTKHTDKRAAVFLDRDGTLIEHRDVFTAPEQIQLLPGVAESLMRLQKTGYLLVVITNQPNVEKGLNTIDEINAQHERLRQLLLTEGVTLDAVYACPHRHPSTCTCRKPGIGMIEEAQRDFSIDIEKSWFIGDTGRDMETGKRAGLKTIFVKTGEEVRDLHFTTSGDYSVNSFKGIIDMIPNKGG